MFGLFRKKPKPSEMWATAQGEEDGKPLIFRYRMAPPAKASPSDFPIRVQIIWRYIPNNDGGMPSAEANDGQIRLEDALDPMDASGLGYLMLVVTGNGRKEWIWYVRTEEAWMAGLNRSLSGHSAYPIEIQVGQDPNWSTYIDFQSGVTGV